MGEENKPAEETPRPKKKHKVLKIVLSVLLVIILIPCIFLAAVSIYHHTYKVNSGPETIENSTGLIQASGRSLYDKDGKKIRLRGVNVGNALVNEGWLSFWCDGNYSADSSGEITYPDFNQEQLLAGLKANPNLDALKIEEILAYYRSKWFSADDFVTVKDTLKMNVLRLPVYWRDFLNDDLSRKTSAEAFLYLDWFLTNCKLNGIYCVLDLHGCPGSQNGYEHSGLQTEGASFWSHENYISAVVDLWSFISEHYTNTAPDLGAYIASYDLINEPTSTAGGKTDKIVWDVYDRIYKAIRSVGDKHVITMEGSWDFSVLPNPDTYSWTNIQYSYHWYNWYHDKLPYNLYYDYMDMKNMGKDYNVPVNIGEFTYFEDKKAWQEGLKMFDDRNYSWTIWTYKAAVTGWWTTSWGVYTYQMNLEATKGETKINVRKATYEELKAAIDKCTTDQCATGTCYDMIQQEMAS
jgi:cell division protein FtsL